MSPRLQSFRNLLVWQKAFDLCLQIYDTSRALPWDERFGLTSELRKTARSVVYNVAEGHRRTRTLEFLRFIDIARGSAAELTTQLMLCEHLGYVSDTEVGHRLAALDEIERMLAGLKRRLASRGED